MSIAFDLSRRVALPDRGGSVPLKEHGAVSVIPHENFRTSEKAAVRQAFVDRAQRMARFIEDSEAQDSDRDKARQAVARRYGIATSMLRALRYQPPKQIAADIYDALCQAVEDTARRQIKRLEDEIALAKRGRLGARSEVAGSAEAALRKAMELLTERPE